MSPGERERRAIQPRNTAERVAADGAAARRTGGQAMIERRTGKQQQNDINALITPPQQRAGLRRQEARGALPGQTGTGNYSPPPTSSGGTGVASPVKETAGSRLYHEAPVVISSTDGSLFMSVLMPARFTMLDAEGREIVFEYERQ